jgi:hypothetical protein
MERFLAANPVLAASAGEKVTIRQETTPTAIPATAAASGDAASVAALQPGQASRPVRPKFW